MFEQLLSSPRIAEMVAWTQVHGAVALGFLAGLLAWTVRHPGFFFFLTLPGVIVHELSHWFMAAVLGGRPSRLSVVPVQDPSGRWILGSVRFHATWWNGSFVALAPLVGNCIAAAAAVALAPGELIGGVACGYLSAVILRHATLSRADLGVIARQPAGAFALLGLLTWALQEAGWLA